eukprot:scaffold85102_cov30-Phaeocystis_antarctica.AAC.1
MRARSRWRRAASRLVRVRARVKGPGSGLGQGRGQGSRQGQWSEGRVCSCGSVGRSLSLRVRVK